MKNKLSKIIMCLALASNLFSGCKKDDSPSTKTNGNGTGGVNVGNWTWRTYNTFNSGLASNNGVALASSNSEIFACTDGGGVSVFRNNAWTTFTSSNSNLPSDYVLAAAADSTGNCYLTCWQSATCKLNGNNIVNFTSGSTNEYGYGCTLAPDGKIWYCGSYGIKIFDGNIWSDISLTYLGISSEVDKVVFDNQGNAWLATSSDGLLCMATNGVINNWNTGNSGLASNNVNDILCETNGKVYLALGYDGFGTNAVNTGGFQIFDGTTWTTFTKDNSILPCNRLSCVAKSKDGSIWIGAKDNNYLMTGGLLRFDGNNFQLFQEGNSGLPSNYIEDITADPINGIWITTNGEGVASFK
jgi:ligand-binding sensor domain-containing protein